MLTAKDNLGMIEHIQQLIHKIQARGKCNGVNGIKSLKQFLPCDSVRLLVLHLHTTSSLLPRFLLGADFSSSSTKENKFKLSSIDITPLFIFLCDPMLLFCTLSAMDCYIFAPASAIYGCLITV